MIPMKMGEQDIDHMLGYAFMNDFFSQISDPGSGIHDGNPVYAFTQYADAGGIAAISFKFSAANRKGPPHAIKLDFHGSKFYRWPISLDKFAFWSYTIKLKA